MQYNILMDTSWVLGAPFIYGQVGYVIVGIPIAVICFFILNSMIQNYKGEKDYYKKKAEEEKD